MKKLRYRLRRKKQICSLYYNLLNKDVRFFDTAYETALWLNDIIVKKPKVLAEYLQKENINTRLAYPGIHIQPPYASDGPFPNSEYGASHILYLPSSYLLTDDEVVYVCEKVKTFLENNK
jgi:dTDP-4-amino-4,6-dideoxygalactose transaminase